MKRTDFTQNFPGGIIKGDSRCREGEEMEEKIDLNVCYRRAFEALGITGSVQKFTDYITEYAPVVLIVLDIGGKILAMSHKGEYNENEIQRNCRRSSAFCRKRAAEKQKPMETDSRSVCQLPR